MTLFWQNGNLIVRLCVNWVNSGERFFSENQPKMCCRFDPKTISQPVCRGLWTQNTTLMWKNNDHIRSQCAHATTAQLWWYANLLPYRGVIIKIRLIYISQDFSYELISVTSTPSTNTLTSNVINHCEQIAHSNCVCMHMQFIRGCIYLAHKINKQHSRMPFMYIKKYSDKFRQTVFQTINALAVK